MPPDEPVDDEKIEELPQDGETPFRPAHDVADNPNAQDPEDRVNPHGFDDTHPSTDDKLDSQELYDEGPGEAAGISGP